MKNYVFISLLLLAFSANAQTIQSPSQEISLTFSLSADGKPTYQVSYKNKPIVKTSSLGIKLKEGGDLITGFTIDSVGKGATIDTYWKPVLGEQSTIRNNYNELTIALKQKSSDRNLNIIPRNPNLYQIACIDDSPLILDEMERFLGNKGKYQLTKLEDPIQASKTIFRLKPDLILMDITMPDINGYKLCSLFRNSEALATTPIIMVTGNKGLVDRVRANMVGATDYLTKPFTQPELLEMVEKYLT